MATAEVTTKKVNKRITLENITLQISDGSDSTLIASWSWSKSSTGGYRVIWQYLLNGIWFDGKDEIVGKPSGVQKYDTFDIPNGATQIRFKIKPVSKTTTVNYKENEYIVAETVTNNDGISEQKFTTAGGATGTQEVYIWSAEWSDWKVYKVPVVAPDITPEVPSVEASIDGYTLTIKSVSYDPNTTHIAFQIYWDNTSIYQETANIGLSANVASYTIFVPNGHIYKARARGYNNIDKSMSEWSEWTSDMGTAPTGPPYINVSALSSTSVKISWERVDPVAESYEIEYTTDLSFFDQSTSVQSSTVAAKYPYAIIEGIETGKTWYFRVRAKNSNGDSEWSPTASCVLGTDPEAPTTWSSTSTAVYSDTIYLYWIHNCEDGSPERQANVVVEWPNGTKQDLTIKKSDDSQISQTNFTITNSSMEGQMTWKVRTMGITGVYGPFSETATIKILIQPTLGISMYRRYEWLWDPFNFETDTIYTAQGAYSDPYPGGEITITQYPIFIVVTMYPMSQKPMECNFSIYANESYQTLDYLGRDSYVNEGDQVFSKDVVYVEPDGNHGLNQNQIALMITPGDVILENFTSYRLVCTVASNNGLSASGELTFNMDLPEDSFVPDAEIGIDRSAFIAYIRPECYDEEDNVKYGVRMTVYRRQFDGGLIQVGEPVSSGSQTMLIDPHPNLNYTRYRIVAYSETDGNFSYYDMPAFPVGVPEIVVQWDERYESFNPELGDYVASPVWNGSMIRLPFNVDLSESNTIDVELVEYIGREHPVSYYGTQVGQTMSLSADIDRRDTETIYSLRRLARYMGDVYVREPNGAGYWAQIGVSFSSNHTETVIPVSLSVTRVEGGV